jgi:hypothetical protein
VWPLLVVVDLEVCGLAARCTCTHAVRMQQCTYAMHMPACTHAHAVHMSRGSGTCLDLPACRLRIYDEARKRFLAESVSCNCPLFSV